MSTLTWSVHLSRGRTFCDPAYDEALQRCDLRVEAHLCSKNLRCPVVLPTKGRIWYSRTACRLIVI